jgi:hypothetical protein
MAKEVIEIDVKTNISGAKSLSDLKGEFKELQKELSGLEQGSEKYIQTLKQLGNVKDEIGDLRSEIEGFAGTDKKVAAFGNVIGGVASGFAAAQGAAALFGAESESVEKALLKVQAAMALAQGIQGIVAMGDSLKVMKTVAIDTFNGIKAAIGASGIGLLIVALGTIVAYWDDIKGAINGANDEQKKLLDDEQKSVQAAQNKLDSISKQENILKLQGKTEREILVLKQKATDEEIKALEAQLITQEEMKKSQVETSRRNHDILQGIISFITAPINILLKGIDMVGSAFGKNFDLAERFTGGLASLIFDPEETAAEADKTIDETKKKLEELKNARAGYQLQINAIDKTASNEAKKLAEDDDKWKREFEKEVLRRQAEMDKELADQKKKKQEEADKLEAERIEAEIQAEQKRLDKQKAARLKALEDYKKGEEQKVELTKQGLTAISSLADAFAGEDEASQKRAFEVKKAAGIAIATIETYQSASSAYSSQMAIPTPDAPIRAAVAAGIAIATGVARIATIAKTQFKSSATPSTGGGGSNLGTFSQGGGTQAPGLTSQNNVTQLNPDGSVAGQGNREMQPMKAYVVESESRAVTDRVNKLSNQSKIG